MPVYPGALRMVGHPSISFCNRERGLTLWDGPLPLTAGSKLRQTNGKDTLIGAFSVWLSWFSAERCELQGPHRAEELACPLNTASIAAWAHLSPSAPDT